MTIEGIYKLYSKHYLVDTDTRTIRKNAIYFALKGENFNGNKFAEEALKKGALYSIVDEKKFATSNRIILVEDVLETLQRLATYHRNQLAIPIIALTGSNGKTTTKELIKVVLETQYKTTATLGNLNNHIGVPLTLLAMKTDTEVGIVEMGANHKKEIGFLCELARPDYGYITNFGKAHLEGFGSIEGVIEGKSEMYKYLRSNDKTVFINPKDKIQLEKSKGITSIRFNFETLNYIDSNPYITLRLNTEKIKTNLIGKYNFSNICAAITIGKHFSISNNNIKNALEKYSSNNNRSQIIQLKNNTIVLDAYNANPTSMKAAVDNFNSLDLTNKTIILGDMFELGHEAIREHQMLVDYCDALKIEKRFYIGTFFSDTQSSGMKFTSLQEFINYLDKHPLLNNNSILIKGSRGMALEQLIDIFK